MFPEKGCRAQSPDDRACAWHDSRSYLAFSTAIDARIVWTDGRPHAPAVFRRWLGDSRGRWDGNTFVVDTVRFSEKTSVRGSDEHLHLVERFTRVDADTLNYEFTVEDPVTWTRPWSARIPWTKIDPDEQMYEYACHEDNFDMVHFLTGARAREQRGETVGPRRAG